ncbi:hypothetical protein AB0O07_15790 [Streptomyces sp. NPDC093085]|uniref:hypothetical protein n=1 Tax=Streptomyces sp. NPDC093085 TaxID=3155068 RepID=UPI00343A166B
MIYNFLAADVLEPSRLGDVLAEILHVNPAAVDAADSDGPLEGRDWEAPVLCDYAALGGDVALLLEIQLAENFPEAPGVVELAAVLSQRLDTVLLWHAEEAIPSAYWAATPEGAITRARVDQSDGPDLAYTVAVVEEPIARFPSARVRLIPEIFREEVIATPTTDAFVVVVDPEGVAHGVDTANRDREWLLLWERLVRRMAGEWGPTGRYPLESYVEDLRVRDRLGARLAAAGDMRGPLGRAVGELDAVFLAHTKEQGCEEVFVMLGEAGAGGGERGWWWFRRPVRVPWGRGTGPR